MVLLQFNWSFLAWHQELLNLDWFITSFWDVWVGKNCQTRTCGKKVRQHQEDWHTHTQRERETTAYTTTVGADIFLEWLHFYMKLFYVLPTYRRVPVLGGPKEGHFLRTRGIWYSSNGQIFCNDQNFIRWVCFFIEIDPMQFRESPMLLVHQHNYGLGNRCIGFSRNRIGLISIKKQNCTCFSMVTRRKCTSRYMKFPKKNCWQTDRLSIFNNFWSAYDWNALQCNFPFPT